VRPPPRSSRAWLASNPLAHISFRSEPFSGQAEPRHAQVHDHPAHQHVALRHGTLGSTPPPTATP
jgi:hypothetical protein